MNSANLLRGGVGDADETWIGCAMPLGEFRSIDGHGTTAME